MPVACLCLCLCLPACAGFASFSSHRTARLLAPHETSYTGAVGYAHYELLDDPIAADGFAVEAMVRRGFDLRTEGGLRVSHLRWDGPHAGHNTILYVDATWSLLPDRLAFTIPIGIAAGVDDTTGDDWDLRHLQAQPTLLWTGTLSRTLELDASARLIVSSANGLTTYGVLSSALTFGIRLRSDASRIEFHPELGLMVDDLTRKYEGMSPHRHDLGESLTFGVSLGVTFLP